MDTLADAISTARRENRTADELALRLQQADLESLPAAARVEALLSAAVLSEHLGNPKQADELAGRALQLAIAHSDSAGRVNALSELGVQARTRGDFEQSKTLMREAAVLAVKLGDKRLMARSRANLAVTLRRAGEPDRAFDESQAAARMYRDLGDLGGANRMLHLQAQIQQDQGLLHEARATLEEVIGLDAMVGDDTGRARSLGTLGLLLWRMGELAEAAGRLEQAKGFFSAAGNNLDVIRAQINLGLVRRTMGEVDTALECFRAAADSARALGLPQELALALSGRAGTLVMLGRFDEAEACLDAGGTGDYRLEHTNLLTRSRIAAHRGDHASALEHARAAGELARLADNPYCIGAAMRIEADLMLRAGEFEAAREAVLEALEHLAQGGQAEGAEHLICTALAAEIEHALGAHEEAAQLTQAAKAMAERHESNPDPDVLRAIVTLGKSR